MMNTLFQSKVSDSEARELSDGVSESEEYGLLSSNLAIFHTSSFNLVALRTDYVNLYFSTPYLILNSYLSNYKLSPDFYSH